MRGLLRLNTRFAMNAMNRFSYSNITLKMDHATHSAWLTLTNEKKRNPLSLETINEIQSALGEVAANIEKEKLKILILKGQGPVFSAGHDLKEIKASSEPAKIFQECTQALLFLKRLPIVTLCVIDGVTAAAGFQLALTCDMIIASEKSTFSTPGVKWGLFCSTPGVQLIRSISSEKKAREMLLFGQPISAQEAHQYGLINKVVKSQHLDEQVNSYINKVHKLSGEVIALGKSVLHDQIKTDLVSAYCIAAKGMNNNILNKSDCKEGLTAFAEKRHPHFKN